MSIGNRNTGGVFSCIDQCENCGRISAKVIDSRLDDSQSLRLRRKECTFCGHRWNTIEITEDDFNNNTSGMATPRDIVALQQTAEILRKQIASLQQNAVLLNNITNNIDKQADKRAKAIKKQQDAMQMQYHYRK